MSPQVNCITNQIAEDLLEQLIISTDHDFISCVLEPLLKIEQPPKLQTLLRMIQNKLKYIQKIIESNNVSQYPTPAQSYKLIENLKTLSDVLSFLMGNQNADVRKSVVFCLVEIHSVIQDDDTFQQIFLQKLN